MHDAFGKTLQRLLSTEGWWSVDIQYKGGIVFCGISKEMHPSWPGWAHIRVNYRMSAPHKGDATLMALVEAFYLENYWNALRCDELGFAAAKVFDMAVNFGVTAASMLIQQAVYLASGELIAVDGRIGSRTIAAVARCQQDMLLGALAALCCHRLVDSVKNDHSQQKFFAEGLARALER